MECANSTAATSSYTECVQLQQQGQSMPTGIANNGNTCFINSLLQCMIHTLSGEDVKIIESSTNILDETMSSVISKMAKCHTCVDIGRILGPLVQEMYKCLPGQQGQNDPQECFQLCMHTKGHVESLFKFAMNETCKCQMCSQDVSDKHTVDTNYLKILTHGTESAATTIRELLLENVSGEIIKDFVPVPHVTKHGVSCGNSKGAYRFEYFKDTLPRCLCITMPSVVQFSRAQHGPYKNESPIFPELSMELPEFSRVRNMIMVKYKLHAVLVHIGNRSTCGHYVAYVLQSADDAWYRMDDAKRAERVDLSDIQKQNRNEYIYMVFYSRC